MAYPSPVQTCSSKPWTNLTNEKLSNESTEEKGPYALKTAMAKSVNTYFVQMISDIGICPVVKMTDKLHVVQGNGDKLPEVPAITLGSKGISPLTMASAYATFASRGMYCTPIAIESITQKADGREKSLEVPKSTCSRAMSEKTADTVNTLLQGVIDSGTGQQAGLSDRDNAGKTGTTDERKNAWFVGYTPNLSGAVWVGSPKQNVKMTGISIGGVYHDLVYGGQVPGPIWKDAMTGALVGKDSPSFNLVDIPDEKPKDNGHGPTDGNNGANANGGNTTNGNTVNGNTISGNTISGATGATGSTNGGGFPTPTFSLPSGFIQGQNGNGGRHG
jgi:membrane peptidoglycan carboxypeptidase